MIYRVVIIDDEAPARRLIKRYLEKYDMLKIVGEADNGIDAAKLINKKKPDIAFLDIKMPKISGLELLDVVGFVPKVIFTTAYDEFALQAFDKNAVDYLLKPFSSERFDAALSKAIEQIKNQKLPTDKGSNPEKIKRIVAKKNSELHIIAVEEIFLIEAQDDYVFIHSEKERFLKNERMKFYEENLPKVDFVRVHRSFIVNINFVKKIELMEKDSYIVLLSNGLKARASKTGYRKLKEKLRI